MAAKPKSVFTVEDKSTVTDPVDAETVTSVEPALKLVTAVCSAVAAKPKSVTCADDKFTVGAVEVPPTVKFELLTDCTEVAANARPAPIAVISAVPQLAVAGSTQ